MPNQILLPKKSLHGHVMTFSARRIWIVAEHLFISFEEGLCVQILHIGAYDEPKSLALIEDFMVRLSLCNDIGGIKDGLLRIHHDVYLNNPNQTTPRKLKTILRIPAREC